MMTEREKLSLVFYKERKNTKIITNCLRKKERKESLCVSRYKRRL
jgi:hypothetical protein